MHALDEPVSSGCSREKHLLGKSKNLIIEFEVIVRDREKITLSSCQSKWVLNAWIICSLRWYKWLLSYNAEKR